MKRQGRNCTERSRGETEPSGSGRSLIYTRQLIFCFGVLLFNQPSIAAEPLLPTVPKPTLHNQRVKTPSLSITPNKVTLRPGEAIEIEAIPHGGEAIRFSIDWTIIVGADQIEMIKQYQQDDRTLGAHIKLIAKPDAEGIVRIRANLHEYPNANAELVVTFEPK